MSVAFYDPYIKDWEGHEKNLELDELLSSSDVISIHVIKTDETENLISKEKLDLLKKSAILINTSRGGVVNEEDLIEFNKINYVSDVWLNEPIPSKEIIDFSLISTPHIAGHSFDGKISGTIKIINYLQNFLELEKSNKIFNIEVLSRYLSNNKSDIDLKKVDNVIASTTFEKLKNLENKLGFEEKSSKMEKNFFNLGKKNKWQDILDKDIEKMLTKEFKKEMKELNYL